MSQRSRIQILGYDCVSSSKIDIGIIVLPGILREKSLSNDWHQISRFFGLTPLRSVLMRSHTERPPHFSSEERPFGSGPA
jgi:hypothetical protein